MRKPSTLAKRILGAWETLLDHDRRTAATGLAGSLETCCMSSQISQSFYENCREPGSNRGPSDLQSDALPAELSRLVRNAVALTAGALLLIEASAALSCARRLHIRSSWAAQALAISFGRDIGHAETRDRTGDFQIFSLTLSQLSYRGYAPNLKPTL